MPDGQRTAFRVLLAISFCHLLNDMLQSLLPAMYPVLKRDFALDFAAVTDEIASAVQRRDTMMSILTRMGLASKADVSATKLSQVELRKMELARAMATT